MTGKLRLGALTLNLTLTLPLGLAGLAGVADLAGAGGCAALPLRAEEPHDATWKQVDDIFGAAGKDLPGGVHRFGWPRRDLRVKIGDVPVEPTLALGSWGAFAKAGHGDQAMAMGDLVLLETELAPVVSALEGGGIEVTAVHNHLAGESPHVVYLHFSGRGEAAALATSLKNALRQTATPAAATATPAKLLPADEQAFDTVQRVLGRKGALAGTVLQVAVPRAAGDFGSPLAIHDRVLPGIPEMTRLKARIHYSFEETDRGGKVRITTPDPQALAAVHSFLRAQIVDHRTGDPTEPGCVRESWPAAPG